jgi:hypothetical protein
MEDAERRSVREAALMARLKRHRDNIARLEERKAKYGLNVPLELENELADERAMKVAVEAQLQHLMAGGEDPLDRLFHEATTARLTGRVGRALQLYEQIQREDPTYPDIAVHVMRTKQELERGYIDNGGRVIPERVIAPAPAPCLPPRKYAPAKRARIPSSLMILILLGVCILLAIGLYLLLRGGL